MRLPRFLGNCFWATVLGVSLPGGASAETTRADLLQRRQAVQSNYERELRACQARFVVTACVDEARLRRRVADAPLREALLQMDARDRQQRAAQRRRVVAEKQRESAARLAEPLASAPMRSAVDTAQPVRGAESTEQPPPMLPSGAVTELRLRQPGVQTPIDAEATRRQREAQRRREQSEAAQARVLRRLQSRQAQSQRPTPLPLPGSPAPPTAASAPDR